MIAPTEKPEFSLQSALTVPNRGIPYYLIRPAVVLRDGVRLCYEFLAQILVAELRGRASDISSAQHAASIVIVAVLAILFFQFKALEEGVVIGFMVLWTAEAFFNMHLGVWTRQRVVTRFYKGEVHWRRYSGNTVIDSLVVDRSHVAAAVIEPEVMTVDAFGHNGKTVWRIKLVVADSVPLEVSEYPTVCKALAEGNRLAGKLGIPITIPRSEGIGRFAGRQARPVATFGHWESEQRGDDLILIKRGSPLRAFQRALGQYGILFFTIAIADILSRIGFFLSIYIGLHPSPGASISLSATEIAMLVLPEFSLLNGIELLFAIVMLAIGFRVHLRSERLRLHAGGVSFNRTREPLLQLRARGKVSVIKLDVPEEGLLFVGDDGDAILIEEPGEEYLQQPFNQSLRWLTRVRISA